MVDKKVVCLCHDVTSEEIVQVVGEGYGHLETVKRFTGAMMGPCQGKMCREAILELFGSLVPEPPAGRGPASRPPALPVRLGALAGENVERPDVRAKADGEARGPSGG
jgi:bacterioferritin-associated ferredoxin